MKRILKSPKFHLIVIALVILDCFCVSIELLVEIIISMKNQKALDKLNTITRDALEHMKLDELMNSTLNIKSMKECKGSKCNYYELIKIDQLSQFMNQNTEFHINNLTSENLDMIKEAVADSDFYAMLHRIESVLKYIGRLIF